MYPWVRKLYLVLGLGTAGRLPRHFRTPVLYWINFCLRLQHALVISWERTTKAHLRQLCLLVWFCTRLLLLIRLLLFLVLRKQGGVMLGSFSEVEMKPISQPQPPYSQQKAPTICHKMREVHRFSQTNGPRHLCHTNPDFYAV